VKSLGLLLRKDCPLLLQSIEVSVKQCLLLDTALAIRFTALVAGSIAAVPPECGSYLPRAGCHKGYSYSYTLSSQAVKP